MNQPKTRVMKGSAFLLAIAALFGAMPGSAQQDSKVNAVIGEQTKTEEAAQASQKRVAELDDETTGIVAEYRQLLAETQSLKVYNEQLGQQVKSQDEELQSMSKQISQIETTSREVLPMMVKMVDTLDQFVKLDLPFLPEERAQRLGALKEMMTSADVSLSEKYRRIIEAYQIETEYGRTIEQYEGKVGAKTADFLRVGRLTLAYQTLDGDETGYWDAAGKKWIVDNGYRETVKQGLKIAKKQAAPDLLVVPVPAPKGAQ